MLSFREKLRESLEVKKWLICSWKHEEDRCYPEVWDRGLDGPWHCAKCHPCGKGLIEWLESVSRKKHRLWAQSLENRPF